LHSKNHNPVSKPWKGRGQESGVAKILIFANDK
jgi:hypothetical protein